MSSVVEYEVFVQVQRSSWPSSKTRPISEGKRALERGERRREEVLSTLRHDPLSRQVERRGLVVRVRPRQSTRRDVGSRLSNDRVKPRRNRLLGREARVVGPAYKSYVLETILGK